MTVAVVAAFGVTMVLFLVPTLGSVLPHRRPYNPSWVETTTMTIYSGSAVAYLLGITPAAIIIGILSPPLAVLAAQRLISIRGPYVVYYLRRGVGDDHPGWAGWTAYIGSGDWDERAAVHRNELSPEWAPWKANLDWAISGPVRFTMTRRAAYRVENRRIRTHTYAHTRGVFGCPPPIENDLSTVLRRHPHPLLRLYWAWLQVEGLYLPSRATHRTPVSEPFDHRAPVHHIDLDGRTVIDVEPVDAEESGASTPDRSDPVPGPESAGPVGADDETEASTVEPPQTSADAPIVPPVSPDRLTEPSHSAVSHRDPVGVPPEHETRRETRRADETDLMVLDDDRYGFTVDDWVDEEAPDGSVEPDLGTGGSGTTRGGRRASGGPRPEQIRARQLRGEGLSLDEVRLRLEDEGTKVSKATVQRWCKG